MDLLTPLKLNTPHNILSQQLCKILYVYFIDVFSIGIVSFKEVLLKFFSNYITWYMVVTV